MDKTIILLLFIGLNLSAQNATNKGWFIQEIHYPEIELPKEYKEYQININPNSDNVRLIINKELKPSSFKNPDISDSVHNLINLIGFSKSENPDFILEFTDLGIKHKLSVEEETKGYGENRGKVYTGFVKISSSIKLVVKDMEGAILFDKVFTKEYESENAGIYNNETIKSSEIALSQIKKQYIANAIEYRSSKNINLAEDVIRGISESLKSKFSSYYESKRINLFLIKKEEKFGVNNNKQVEKLIASENKLFKDYESLAKESLALFTNELKKITNRTDKKQKKIYWGLLSNISGVYYALGNYDKAIEHAKMRKEIDYNKKWNYNLEISQDRKAITLRNKDFDFAEATKVTVPEKINIQKIGSYRNHIVSAVLEINTLNKLTENVRFRDRAVYYENQIFSTLIVLRIPNHYKKSSKESADHLKGYKKMIEELRSYNLGEEKAREVFAREVFFKKYPYDHINKTVDPPNMDFMIKTFNLTEEETAVFTGILEKYYMIIKAYSYGKEEEIKDYEKKNTQLKENINRLILSRNFTKPIETEILLSLEYLNNQASTKGIKEEQIDNILYNLKTYCSSFSS